MVRWILGLGFVGWLIALLVNVAILGAVGYVAWHFITKFW